MSPSRTAPRVAIPVPHSGDRDYAERALPKYERAVSLAGGEPVRIELDLPAAQMRLQIESCDAVLLPGSRADIDPLNYGAEKHEKTAAADPKRDAVDEILLEDAYKLRKPVLGICYGLQSLNVHKTGTLVQHIESNINHSAGRAVPKAHAVQVIPETRLAKIVSAKGTSQTILAVNSSHHQSADSVGEGLRVAARSVEDGIVEALEGTATDHFVLAIQWHPERSVDEGPELADSAKSIFRAFIEAAQAKHEELSPPAFQVGQLSKAKDR